MVVLQPFEPNDIVGVMNLGSRVLSETYTYDFYLKMAAACGEHFRVARDERAGRVVGFVLANREPGLQSNVLLLAVDPAFQGQGLGGALLRDVQRTLVLDNVRTVKLEVRTDNARAIEFYRTHGFRVQGLEVGAYADGADALAMSKPLL